jgi:hypothetical protein
MNKKKAKLRNKDIPNDTIIREVVDYLHKPILCRDLNEAFPTIPFLMLFIAKSKSGKSNFIANFLMKNNIIGMLSDKPIFKVVHIISPSILTDKSMQLYSLEQATEVFVLHHDINDIENIVRNIVEEQEEYDPKDEDPEQRPPNICIYIDDCASQISKSKYLMHFFTVYRHFNISLIVSLQNIKGIPPIIRTQATAVFLSQCYNYNERSKISEHWADSYKGEELFYKLWDDACDKFYQFFYLKLDDFYPRCFVWGGDQPLTEYYGLYPEQEKQKNDNGNK